MTTERKIIHVDMDCFFAAVEQRDKPELRGKPVAVGNDEERSVVTTASYEARKFGVHSAQSVQVAKRLCPSLIIVPCHFEKYRAVNHQLSEIFHDYTDQVEFLSIDEAFLDVTENKKGMELAVDIAREIKRRIHEELQLTASAGVSYCKLLAKIASDYRKPDGLCTIHPDKALRFIAHLPVTKLWGVGPKTAERLHQMGIYTGEQLREYSLHSLIRDFGKMGQVFYNFARGIDERPVVTTREAKSVGCERTFEKDLHTQASIIVELYHVTLELVERIKKHKFEGRTLTLKVKYSDFTQITRSLTRQEPLRTKKQILPLAKQLLSKTDTSRPIRLLGLSVSSPKEEDMKKLEWIQLEFDFGDESTWLGGTSEP